MAPGDDWLGRFGRQWPAPLGRWPHRRLVLMLVVTVGLAVGILLPYSVATTEAQSLPPTVGNESFDGYVAVGTQAVANRLLVRGPDERIVYGSRSYTDVFDIDPVSPDTPFTLTYVAVEKLDPSSPDCSESTCARQLIIRTNITTENRTVLYETVNPGYNSEEWHDADRLNETHFVVADITRDAVIFVDIESGTEHVVWNASQHYDHDRGGPYPEDWTHINDVEVLPDGRIMASIRNFDEVVFIDPETGTIDEDWTLGTDENHTILYEQHNPDFIPNGSGPPAVLIADSENNRIVEYQRTAAGGWERTWTWQDPHLTWPRDADRLPSGRTLVTDTTGSRAMIVDRQGEVLWHWNRMGLYEAELLGTSDESVDNITAQTADLPSRVQPLPPSGPFAEPHDWLRSQAELLLPAKWIHGLLFVLPWWLQFGNVLALLAAVLATVGLAVGELRYRRPLA